MSTDRHKSRPKAVRMPGGLLAWYGEHAKAAGRPVNAVLVQALEEFRARNDGATTAAPARKRGATTRRRPPAPVAAELAQERSRDQREDDCPHPAASVMKGRCSRCQTFVGFS